MDHISNLVLKQTLITVVVASETGKVEIEEVTLLPA